jgi:hypothetical protein
MFLHGGRRPVSPPAGPATLGLRALDEESLWRGDGARVALLACPIEPIHSANPTPGEAEACRRLQRVLAALEEPLQLLIGTDRSPAGGPPSEVLLVLAEPPPPAGIPADDAQRAALAGRCDRLCRALALAGLAGRRLTGWALYRGLLLYLRADGLAASARLAELRLATEEGSTNGCPALDLIDRSHVGA